MELLIKIDMDANIENIVYLGKIMSTCNKKKFENPVFKKVKQH